MTHLHVSPEEYLVSMTKGSDLTLWLWKSVNVIMMLTEFNIQEVQVWCKEVLTNPTWPYETNFTSATLWLMKGLELELGR